MKRLALSVLFLLMLFGVPTTSRADVPIWCVDCSGPPGSVESGWQVKKEFDVGSLFDISNVIDRLSSSFVPSMDSIMRMLGTQLTRSVTHSVAEWIRTGEFDGGPLFISNLDDYLSFALDEASGVFIDALDADTQNLLCSPFRPQISQYMHRRSDADFGRINFFSQHACTASDIVNNVERMRDFKNVGWEGWQRMSQPQNNFFGAVLNTEDEYNRRIMSAQRSQENQYLAGGGSLGQRECVERTSTGRCARYRTNTPGSVALGAINQQLGTDAQTMIQADEANELASALMDRVFSELGLSSSMLQDIQQGLYMSEKLLKAADPNR